MLAPPYALHEITEDYDDFTSEELEKMRKSLLENGLLYPILVWNGRIVDGRHREKLCRELGITPEYRDISIFTEEKMRGYVAAMNQDRRARTKPLTPAEKRKRIEEELKRNPTGTNREIAKAAGVSNSTVHEVKKSVVGPITEYSTRPPSQGRAAKAAAIRAKAAAALKANADRTDDEIGKACGVSTATVQRVRKELLSDGSIERRVKRGAQPGSRTGKGLRAEVNEKREHVEAAYRANPQATVKEIHEQTGLSRDMIAKVRNALRSGSVIEDRRGAHIPDGKLLSVVCAEGLALEQNEGISAEEAAPRIKLAISSYRNARSIMHLANNPRLPPKDRTRVNAAVKRMDEERSATSAFADVEDLVEKMWGGNRRGPQDSKRETKIIEKYIHAIEIVEEVATQAANMTVPYLDNETLKMVREKLSRARRLIMDAFNNTGA